MGGQGAFTNSQFLQFVAIDSSGLAALVQLLAQFVPLGDQLFALLGVRFHLFNGLFQHLSGSGEVFLLAGLLLLNLCQLSFGALFTGFELFDLNFITT